MNSLSSGGYESFGSDFASSQKTSNKVTSSFWDVQALRAAPKCEVVGESVEKTAGGDVVVRELKYEAPAVGGDRLRIFAYYAFPAARGEAKLPGMVWVHGGASTADKPSIVHWASLGYAVIGMDLPGKGGEARERSRSEGPDMSDKLIFTVRPSPKESYLYLCVNAVCAGISALQAQKEVDRTRIGIVGYSWGGVITLLANAIDDRITAACTVYGAGHIPDESFWAGGDVAQLSDRDRKTWREHFDPSSYSKSLHGKTLFVGATQDIYYPLRSFVKTYQAAVCAKTLYLALNRNHELDEAGTGDVERWFDWALRSGPGLPSVRVKRGKGSIEVTAKGDKPVVSLSVATADGVDYAKASWKMVDAKGSGGSWRLDPPKADEPCVIIARDDSGAAATEVLNLPAAVKRASK